MENKRKPFIGRSIGRLNFEAGWFPGEDMQLLKVTLLEVWRPRHTLETVVLIELRVLRAGFSIWLDLT